MLFYHQNLINITLLLQMTGLLYITMILTYQCLYLIQWKYFTIGQFYHLKFKKITITRCKNKRTYISFEVWQHRLFRQIFTKNIHTLKNYVSTKRNFDIYKYIPIYILRKCLVKQKSFFLLTQQIKSKMHRINLTKEKYPYLEG